MDKKTDKKWYDNPKMVDTLLFLVPPVGMYGLYKTRNLNSTINKILYGILGFISFLLVLISLA